ncbi:MAG: hypothetical protein H0V71_12260 [Chloroflexi bacterium]|nr:hypothetical protein [Chloroflexota bacterium]
MSEDLRKPRIYPRRIVERPRLIQELESSRARIVLLVAGSGYGKTVLAEQWATAEGRTVGWFRARASAADVSVVARGLVGAADMVMPGAGRRLLERLSVTEDPEREASLLAEMLAEDLGDWPETGWLVVDDHDQIAASLASETFLETVIARSPARLLLLGGGRPTWVHADTLASESALELRGHQLAMTVDEMRIALRESASLALDGESLAGGWPALVGLASMLPDAPVPEVSSAGALYEFYSETLLGALPSELGTDLMRLAALPTIDRELAGTVLGTARTHEVCTELIELGLLDERNDQLVLQSLFREFLERRTTASGIRVTSIGAALPLYRERRDWDSAFELMRRFALDDELAGLVLEAVDELLFSGRLSTLERWFQVVRTKRLAPHAALQIAEVEVDLRHGRHATALTKARSLLANGITDGEVAHRLSMVAARAAHAGGREEEALEFYRRSRTTAISLSQDREARWGELMCTSALERPDAHLILSELVGSVVASDARDQVRMADKQLSVGFRFGFVHHLADSRRAAELVSEVADPFVRCSFLSVHAWALALGAHYEEAFPFSTQLVKDAVDHRVDPALPYAYSIQAVVLAGLGRQAHARQAVEMADRLARRVNDENGIQNSYATRVRILLQAGAVAEACAVEPADTSRALPSMRGEVLSSRALALATIGRVDEATELAETAAGATLGIETQALCAAVDAVASLKRRSDDIMDHCDALIEHVFAAGSVDIAVTAYRANPELLAALFASRRIRDQVVYLTRRAGDEPLVEALGLSSSAVVDPATALSNREREVYELVCEGLSNAEIGKRLFIVEGTVKAHVHHVFDKLGIRSRSALALNAARDRYATSTAASSGAGLGGDEGTATPNPNPRAAL